MMRKGQQERDAQGLNVGVNTVRAATAKAVGIFFLILITDTELDERERLLSLAGGRDGRDGICVHRPPRAR